MRRGGEADGEEKSRRGASEGVVGEGGGERERRDRVC